MVEQKSENLGDVQLTEDNGVSKTIITSGEQNATAPKDGMEVSVHYVGTLLNGEKFDSSRDTDTPFKFTLGKGKVIKGWDIGVKSMKLGEKCDLFCTAPYAYGEKGSGEKIPPNSTLKFEVELIGMDYKSLTKDGKIKKDEVVAGEGYKTPKFGALCKIKICGKTKDSNVVFMPAAAKELKVGDEIAPDGLNTILKKMKKGERSRFFVEPSEYGFEEGKLPDGVEPTDVLEFDIEMTSFGNKKEPWEMSDEEKLREAENARQDGNKLYKDEQFAKAAERYEYAVSCLEDFPGVFGKKTSADPLLSGGMGGLGGMGDMEVMGGMGDMGGMEDEEEEDAGEPSKETLAAREQLVACLNNLNIVRANQKKFSDVVENCNKVLRIDSSNVKALYRRAEAKKRNGSYNEALTDLEKLLELDRKNPLFRRTLGEVKRLKKAEEKSVSTMYRRMFDGIGK